MKIGVDSSVVIAAVHANHPSHAMSATWLTQALIHDELVVSHHSVLEAYAVLTRLPGSWRVTPTEARDVLSATVQENMQVAAWRPEDIFACLERLVDASVAGGRSYDAFVLDVLRSAGAQAIATLNPHHFRGLATDIKIIDPSEPPG